MRVEGAADIAVEDDAAPARRGWPWYAALTIGGIGLLGAALVDGIAVLGRHVGFGFLGSIELSQTFICLAASGAIVLATLSAQCASGHRVADCGILEELIHAAHGEACACHPHAGYTKS